MSSVNKHLKTPIIPNINPPACFWLGFSMTLHPGLTRLFFTDRLLSPILGDSRRVSTWVGHGVMEWKWVEAFTNKIPKWGGSCVTPSYTSDIWGGVLKCWVSPNFHVFFPKWWSFWVVWGGYHHLRKHPYMYDISTFDYINIHHIS